MPIYEYRCSKCNTVFEEWVKHFDSPEHERCPQCGGDAARIVSNTSFVLKGKGWYVTDYGNRKADHESGAGAPAEGHGDAMNPGESGTAGSENQSTDKTKAPSTDSKTASTDSGVAGSRASSGDAKAEHADKRPRRESHNAAHVESKGAASDSGSASNKGGSTASPEAAA